MKKDEIIQKWNELWDKAEAFYDEEKFEKAIPAFQKILDFAGNIVRSDHYITASIHHNMGVCCEQTEKDKEAQRC